MTEFNEEKMKEFKETFDLFDLNKDSNLTLRELSNLLRTQSLDLDTTELKEMIEELGLEDQNNVSFTDFLQIMSRIAKEKDMELELIEAFRLFDRENKGTLDNAEFKHTIQTIGQMGDDAIEEMIQEADPHSYGHFNYIEYAKKILNKYYSR